MTSIIEFPGLGITLEVNRVAFTVFGVDIYWYGVLIAVGLLLAIVVAFSQAKLFGLDSDRMIDVIVVGIVMAIICGRLYFVLFVDTSYTTFYQLIDLRAGGVAIYGGIIGAFIGAFLGCKWRKVPVLPMFDIAAMVFPIGQAIGRWGNFFNQEAFGSNTGGPLGMISEHTTAYLTANQAKLAAEGIIVDPFMPVHPTFLYESVWCAVGFLLMFLYRKHRKFNGEIFLFYVIWYGIGRAIIEGLRTDSLMVGDTGIRVSQLLAAASALIAFAIWLAVRVRRRGIPLVVPDIPPHTARVRIATETGPRVIEVSWPADEKTPSQEKKEELAREILEVEKVSRRIASDEREEANTQEGKGKHGGESD